MATELPPESMLVDGSQPTRVVVLGGGADVAASSGAASTLSTLEVRASRRSPASVLACARDRVVLGASLSPLAAGGETEAETQAGRIGHRWDVLAISKVAQTQSSRVE